MNTPAVAALVPMRHTSARVPGKNHRPFAGKPLYHYIIESLLACPYIWSVAVDTDSSLIMEGLRSTFPSVQVIKRPEALRGGMVPMTDVLLYDVEQIEADYYLQTHSTNPLLRSETISAAIKAFLGNHPKYDSLFSVTKIQVRLWDEAMQPINHDPSVLLRTQDLPPVYEENSNLYIFSRDILERRRNRIGDRPLLFEIDRAEAWDIDEEIDFAIAEFLFGKMRAVKSQIAERFYSATKGRKV